MSICQFANVDFGLRMRLILVKDTHDGLVSHRAAALDPCYYFCYRAHPDDPVAENTASHRLFIGDLHLSSTHFCAGNVDRTLL